MKTICNFVVRMFVDVFRLKVEITEGIEFPKQLRDKSLLSHAPVHSTTPDTTRVTTVTDKRFYCQRKLNINLKQIKKIYTFNTQHVFLHLFKVVSVVSSLQRKMELIT